MKAKKAVALLVGACLSPTAIAADAPSETDALPEVVAPHTYSGCAQAGLSDDACHRQIIEAGGQVAASPTSYTGFTPVDFDGGDQYDRYDRWYDEYKTRCLINMATPKPRSEVISYYPGFPPIVPDHLQYR